MPPEPPPTPTWPRLMLRKADQAAAAMIIAVSLGCLSWHWGWWTGARPPIEIERATPETIVFQLDINEADWAELTLLPTVGESLAHRIVAYREEHGPFRDVSELRNVRGVGPKTFERIEPYLLPVKGND
jgi:competence protein ComEA